MGTPYGKRDPYYSHIFRDSYGSGMGIVSAQIIATSHDVTVELRPNLLN